MIFFSVVSYNLFNFHIFFIIGTLQWWKAWNFPSIKRCIRYFVLCRVYFNLVYYFTLYPQEGDTWNPGLEPQFTHILSVLFLTFTLHLMDRQVMHYCLPHCRSIKCTAHILLTDNSYARILLAANIPSNTTVLIGSLKLNNFQRGEDKDCSCFEFIHGQIMPIWVFPAPLSIRQVYFNSWVVAQRTVGKTSVIIWPCTWKRC